MPASPLSLAAHVTGPVAHLDHFWSACVGAGRANEGLRAAWLEHLGLAVEEGGFRYLRFHGLLHDDMFVYRLQDGQETYNWQYIDELFDRMLAIGIRPFVELSFCPEDMASGSDTMFWWRCNVTPPRDLGRWSELIRRLTIHWIERYGLEEVRRWYFEVWNEPNLHGFWAATRSQYFELYKATALAVKAVDSQLRVGGPATSNFVPDDRFDFDLEDISRHTTFRAENIDAANWRPVWVEAFLDYCVHEGLPVDFISTHPYPTDFAIDPEGTMRGHSRNVDSTRQDLERIRSLVRASAYPQAEIHLTEWSSSPSPRDHSHDYLPAAAFVVKANLESAGLVDSLSYWVFTDVFEESGGGSSIFHGGFGMINFQGIPKPTFHAYRFLNSLGDEILTQVEGAIVTRHSSSGQVAALLYHYDTAAMPSAVPLAASRQEAEDIQAKGSPRDFHLELDGLPAGAAFQLELLDERHGFAIPAWKEMGMPEPPTREQTSLLRLAAWNTAKQSLQADASGRLVVDLSLPSWGLVSLLQQP